MLSIKRVFNFILFSALLVSCNTIEIEPDINIEFDPSRGAVLPLTYYSYLKVFSSTSASFQQQYHCGEDLFGAGGTPVYAAMDGVVSYSGEKPGYGWLITIDHPEQGIYSLYGHLSKSNEKVETDSVVQCGDFIGFIAYDQEDGSGDMVGEYIYPHWTPHLHFAVREGSINDYPAEGDSSWSAHYSPDLPAAIGWYNPSAYMLSKMNEI